MKYLPWKVLNELMGLITDTLPKTQV